MSLNFNKLILQDIMSRRESLHALDLNEENVIIKEESEYSAEEDDDDDADDESNSQLGDRHDDDDDGESDSKLSNYTDEETNINNTETQSGKCSQKFRLISALNNLRLAVDKQAKLQSLLSDYKQKDTIQDSRVLSSKLSTVKEYNNNQTTNDLNDQTNNLLAITTPHHKMDVEKKAGEIESEQKDETSCLTMSKSIQSKVTRRSLKKQHQHNVPDVSMSSADKDALAFRRNERLSKRKEKVSVQIRVVFLKIGEIDTLKEIYHADAFIQAKWREPRLDGKTDENLRKIDLQRCWNPLILIDNILSESKEQHWIIAERNEHDEIFIVERRRLRGVFLETLELNDFPLDVQASRRRREMVERDRLYKKCMQASKAL
ncbi:unnamed protein product [Schistosoma turkestanicum]|nr:unnamed protein product [Schistosoma turkestanicum]